MNNYNLSHQQIAELEKLHRTLDDKRQADKVKAVIALTKGCSACQIAKILLIDEKTARAYFKTYRERGSNDLLAMHYLGSKPKLNSSQMSELEKHLDENLYLDAKTVIRHIKNDHLPKPLDWAGRTTMPSHDNNEQIYDPE